MSKELIGLIGVIAVILLIGFRVWIGAAMALVGFAGMIAILGYERALSALGVATFSNLSVYPITAVPMFALMGMVIAETSIGRDLYNAIYRSIGRFRGGMASATVAASGVLGAITGAEDVAAVILTKIALPQMRELNYDDELSTAAIAGGAPLAIIIPPSLPLILYGILTESSVARLFMGGVFPGIILIIVFCAAISLICRIKPHLGPAGPKFSFKEQMKGMVGVLPVVILFLLVLGGIYGGICTTTEAGAMGAGGAIIIAFATRQMDIKKLVKILREAVVTVGLILILIAGTFIFIQFLNVSRMPQLLSIWITSTFNSNITVLIMVAILYIVLGMVMPQMCMMILTIPLLWPAMEALGFHVVWFGLFVTMMQALGGVTPPIGLIAYMVSGISKVPAGKVFRGLVPFIIAYILVIALICVFPILVTWLPSRM